MILALVLVGLGLFVLSAVVGGDDDQDISISGNQAIEAIFPPRGAEVLQQQTVGIDLAPPYRLTSMRIFPNDRFTDGVEVISEVDEVSGLNQWTFSPAEGKLIEALSPDTNCVFATYVEIARPEESITIDWCFQVS